MAMKANLPPEGGDIKRAYIGPDGTTHTEPATKSADDTGAKTSANGSKLESGKDVNDVNIFSNNNGEYEFNDELLTKDGFIKQLKADKNGYSEEELSKLYDMLAGDDEKVTKEDIVKLAAYGNEKDQKEIGMKFDGAINENDIEAFLEAMDDVDPSALCCDDDCCQPDCSCQTNVAENTVKSVMKEDSRIKTDDAGNRYVNVEKWSSNNKDNNCLSRIISNSYDLDAMGVKPGSEEYKALEKAVMDANPSIYGTEDKGWRKEVGGTGRHNAVLYTDDKIVLPDFEYVNCPCDDEKEAAKPATNNAPAQNTPAQNTGTPSPNPTPDQLADPHPNDTGNTPSPGTTPTSGTTPAPAPGGDVNSNNDNSVHVDSHDNNSVTNNYIDNSTTNIDNSVTNNTYVEGQGEKGDKGDTGEKGDKGDTGEKGDKGDQGVQGEKGDKGDQGVQGEKGDKGDQGVQGEKGDKGDQGVQGEKGDKGDQGVQGEKGDQGEQGIQGEKGDKGDQGIQGEKGDKGDQGIQGEKGDKGDQGIQGEKGDKGDQGVQGEKGDKGDQGIQGEKGDKGDKGDDGQTPNFSIDPNTGHLIAEYPDGHTEDLGKVVGEDGKDGKDGKDGVDGKDGKDGKDAPDVPGTDPGEDIDPHPPIEDTTPADTTPADTTPADTTPADTTPADTTPADTTPADTTPADTTPADTTPDKPPIDSQPDVPPEDPTETTTQTSCDDTAPTEDTNVEERPGLPEAAAIEPEAIESNEPIAPEKAEKIDDADAHIPPQPEEPLVTEEADIPQEQEAEDIDVKNPLDEV